VGGLAERDEQSQPQKPQTGEQEAEVITGGGEDGVDGVAGGMGQVTAFEQAREQEFAPMNPIERVAFSRSGFELWLSFRDYPAREER